MSGELLKTLQRLFYYDAKDGCLRYKVSLRSVKAGDSFGSSSKGPYLRGWIDKKRYSVHRMVFLFHKGYLPTLPNLVDHEDRNKRNNSIENLRDISTSLNARNSDIRGRSTTGIKGVSYDKSRSKWKAIGKLHGINTFLGRFTTKEAAVLVRNKWEKEVNYNE